MIAFLRNYWVPVDTQWQTSACCNTSCFLDLINRINIYLQSLESLQVLRSPSSSDGVRAPFDMKVHFRTSLSNQFPETLTRGIKAWGTRRWSNDDKENRRRKEGDELGKRGQAISALFSPCWFYNSSEEQLRSCISIAAACTESAFKSKRGRRRESEQKVTWEEAQETKISTFDTSNLIKNYISPPKSPHSSSPQSPNPLHLLSSAPISVSLYMAVFVFPFLIPPAPFQFSPSRCVFFSRPTSEFVMLCELSRTFYSE